MVRFRQFPHTADLGLFIYGRGPRNLYRNGLEALAVLLADPAGVKPAKRYRLAVRAASDLDRLLGLLREALYLHDAREVYFARAVVDRCTGRDVRATLWGEPIDVRRHRPRNEIKAVTFHGAELRKIGRRLRARVIFDI